MIRLCLTPFPSLVPGFRGKLWQVRAAQGERVPACTGRSKIPRQGLRLEQNLPTPEVPAANVMNASVNNARSPAHSRNARSPPPS